MIEQPKTVHDLSRLSARRMDEERYTVHPACAWLKRRFGAHESRTRRELFNISLDVDFLVNKGLLVLVQGR